MYKNIFIYLALATAIDGCRGGIRIKRIADSIPGDEKKTVGASATILGDFLPKTVAVTNSEASLKGPNHVVKRQILEGDSVERFTEDPKYQDKITRDMKKINTQGHRTVRSTEGDDVELNKEKGNLVANEKVSEGGFSDLKDGKIGAGNIYDQHSDQGERLERASVNRITGESTKVEGSNISDDKEHTSSVHDQTGSRQMRKTSKREGRTSGNSGTSSLKVLSLPTGNEKHLVGSGNVGGDGIKKLIEDVKLEGHKKELKPDVDVFLYSNVPAFYKGSPVLFEMYNTKESVAPQSVEHYYSPYKWLQRRSPVQSAFEIANMMFKVGLNDLDSDDYGEHVPVIFNSGISGKGGNHKLERGFSADVGFCPIHAKRASLIGEPSNLPEGGPHVGECLCSFGRSVKEVASGKDDNLERIKRNLEHDSHDRAELKPSAIVKSF